MPISGPKNRTIRRKLGPNKNTAQENKTATSNVLESGGEKQTPLTSERKPIPSIGAGEPTVSHAEEKRTAPIGTGEPTLSPGGEEQIAAIGAREPTLSPGGEERTAPRGGYIGGDDKPPVQVIEKIFHHNYTPERSKWWWLKFLCCFLILALLLWILYCLYLGCPCKNNTNTVYMYSNDGISTKKLKEDGISRTLLQSEAKEENRIAVQRPAVKPGEENETEVERFSTEPKEDTGTVEPEKVNTKKEKDSHMNKIEHLEGLFKARLLPDNVEPILHHIREEKVSYKSVDGKNYTKSVASVDVMPYEVSIKDYFYFANGNPGNYPEFWDNSTNDVRKNRNSKYYNSCLEEECPIIGISPKQAEEYVKWLNRRVMDGHYEIMTETQWHQFASYTNLDEEVWHRNNSGGRSHPVNSNKPNKKGIYASYGNVAEVVKMDHGYAAVGGSWKSTENELKKKYFIKPTDRSNWFGFRLVKINDKKDDK